MFEGIKTLAGVLITIAPLAASLFGYDTAPSFSGDASELVAAGVTLLGSALAIYGRIKAKGPMWFQKRSPQE